MHVLDITIHEIVDTDGTPSHARGSAAFSNGYIFEFHANFDHPYDYAIAIIPPPQPGAFQPHSEHAAEIIHVELGFDEIYKRECAAIAALKRKGSALASFGHEGHSIASFRRERIAACRKLMPADTS